MRGVDISYANGDVDWHAIKRAGFDFAIIRTGAGLSIQDHFRQSVSDAHNAGLLCGAYHYSYALTPSRASLEAIFCRRIIVDAGVLLELPVFFDIEDADHYKARHGFNFCRRNVTAICRAFLDNIGLDSGVYASFDWLDRLIDWKALNCPVWNAQWSNHDDLGGFLWQFSDSFNIGGRLFDANILYDDTHKLGLNPWKG